MIVRRLITFGLIAVPAAMTALLSMRYYFSAVLIAVALAGTPGLWQFRMRRERQVLVLVGILLAFAVKWRLQPLTTIGDSTLPFFSLSPLMEYSLAHAIAQALLAFLTALLFLRRDTGLPLYVPLLSANAMVLAGNIPAVGTGANRPTYLWLSLALAGLTALYYLTFRTPFPNGRGRFSRVTAAATLALLAAAVAGGAASSHLLYRHRNAIDVFLGRLVYRMSQGGSVGFSRSARLGSVAAMQAEGGTAVALRIFSDTPPGYLRGLAFDTFQGDNWEIRGESIPAEPAVPPANAPRLQPGETALRLREAPAESGDWRLLTMYPTGRTDRAAFAPLGAACLYTYGGTVSVDREGTPISSTMPRDTSYRVAVPAHPAFEPVTEARREQLLQLPETTDPRVRDLARTLTGQCTTVRGKIDAVTRFFSSNFTYEFGIQIPEDEDPITYFLLQRPPAHCEYFASGAAVLLRLAGVPARYVTGYLVGSKNTYGGYWLARDKDAHAWVEAYDPERGWVLVEATPPGGRPSPEASRWRQLLDLLKYRLQAFREALARGDLAALLLAAGVLIRDVLNAVVTSVWGWAALTVLAALLVRRRWRRRPPRRAVPVSPRVRQCQAMLARMDAHVAADGHTRARGETLSRFALRLREAGMDRPSAWYAAYVEVRYRRDIPPGALDHLENQLRTATTRPEPRR